MLREKERKEDRKERRRVSRVAFECCAHGQKEGTLAPHTQTTRRSSLTKGEKKQNRDFDGVREIKPKWF